MENIYKSPETSIDVEASSTFPNWKRVLTTVFILPPVGLYLLGYKIIPHFMETFASFGSELPSGTIFVLQISPYLLWATLLSCAPLFIWHTGKLKYKHKNILFLAASTHAAVSILEFFLLQWALYAPIVNMGNVL